MTLFLLVLQACTWDAAPSKPPEPEVVQASPDQHVLVWSASRQGEKEALTLSLSTRWVVLRPDGAEVRATTEGLVFADEQGLSRLSVVRSEVPSVGCDGVPGRTSLVELQWQRLPGGPVTVIDPLGSPEGVGTEDRYAWQEALDVDGQVGPWVFLRAHALDDGCGAHPNTSALARIVDLRTGEALDALADPSVRTLVDTTREALLGPLRAPGADGTPRSEAAGPTDLEIARLVPRYGPQGLVMAVQIAAPSCYACSDGRWSSYTVSETRDLPELPALFQPFSATRTFPPTVGPVDGWSEWVQGDTKALEAAFTVP